MPMSGMPVDEPINLERRQAVCRFTVCEEVRLDTRDTQKPNPPQSPSGPPLRVSDPRTLAHVDNLPADL